MNDPMTYRQSTAVLLVMATIALVTVLCGGCNTPRALKADVYPPEIVGLCVEARADAVRWFVAKHGRQPSTVFVTVELIKEPPARRWGTYRNGVIKVWQASPHLKRTIEHEFRHMMEGVTFGDYSEEAIK